MNIPLTTYMINNTSLEIVLIEIVINFPKIIVDRVAGRIILPSAEPRLLTPC